MIERKQTDTAKPTQAAATTAQRAVPGHIVRVLATALLLSASVSLGYAQAPTTGATAGAPATRAAARVARLTFTVGDVRIDRATGNNAQAAVLNMPLSEGSVITTGEDGQAEVEFEDGSVARLTPNSALSLVNLSLGAGGVAQSRLALLHGLGYFELRAGTASQTSVDAQGDLITPVENSTLRVNLDEPPAVIAVLDGMAHIDYQGGQQTSSLADVSAGQSLRDDPIPAQSGERRFLVKQEIDPESWDQWNEARDQAAGSEASNQTAARQGFAGDQGYGWADLDANGSWYDVPGQSPIWQPDVAANPAGDGSNDSGGFDPYDFGNWTWQPGAGYVWASGYGWGWTPYRCGTWNYWNGFGWGWSPNLYCGTYGYGGYGYGINFGNPPRIFRRPIRPVPRPGPHPLVRVHGGMAPVSPGGHVPASTPRTIAGTVATPFPAIGGGSTPRGGTALGGALVRDYPVDKTSHEPVFGAESNHESFGVFSGGGRSTAWRPVGSVASELRAAKPTARSIYTSPQGVSGPSGAMGSRGTAGSIGNAGTVGDRGGSQQITPVVDPEVIAAYMRSHRAQSGQQAGQQSSQQTHTAPTQQSAPRSAPAAPAPAATPAKEKGH